MDTLTGRVAVVTGGASGVGRAMGEAFLDAGMKVVLADVEAPALDATVAELGGAGRDVTGVVTDVSDYPSVEALREVVLDRHGAVHVLCNNAGVGAGAAGQVWDHDLDDWQWAVGVNVWGVVHGVKAFVPGMVASGEPGHVVNTSSGNGGIAPLPNTAIYALTKSAVVTLTEVLWAQLRGVDAAVSASVLFPGPNVLRTGLFSSWRNRPAHLAPVPADRPRTTIESFEAAMEAAGVEITYTPTEEVAARVVDAILADRFWILPESTRTDEQINARASSMLARSQPTYIRDLGA
jgi:NAD(P)-dependent dehydrogenase (short-subunit alcohol dehydrogenase family)